MKNFIRLKASHTARPRRLAASAVAVAAAVAARGRGRTGKRRGRRRGRQGLASVGQGTFKRPKLKHGELRVTGTNASEKIALRLQAGEPGVLQVDVGDDGSADFAFERSEIARIAVRRPRRATTSCASTRPTASSPTRSRRRLAGGRGNDTLAGGKGVETLLGGDGNDSIDGNGGNDVALMGAGDDTFVWDPGDGSDMVEGQAGTDTMLFNGANVAEQVDLSANGNRLTFFRDPGTITMDTAGVERGRLQRPRRRRPRHRQRPDRHRRHERQRRPRSHPRRRHRRRPGRPRRRQRHRRQRHDRRQRGRRRSEGRRPAPRRSGSSTPEAAGDRLEIDTLAGKDTVDPAAWPPVRSSSSWTACSSRRETRQEDVRGPPTRGPRGRCSP